MCPRQCESGPRMQFATQFTATSVSGFVLNVDGAGRQYLGKFFSHVRVLNGFLKRRKHLAGEPTSRRRCSSLFFTVELTLICSSVVLISR